jgi:Xaa-Pro aminopeptidase
MVPLKRAIDITVEAQREAMRSLTPGMHEYEAQALIEYVFARNGSEYPGFPSIVGSGENTVILHYESNRRRTQPGDLVLMDIGAEVHGYTADVTRTVPVSGTFSPEQKAIYEIVLRAQDAGIQASRAGSPFGAPHQAAARVLAAGLAQLGLITSPTDAEGLRRFFMHGTSHYLGLDVHDVGAYGPLEAGTVITVEPGIYIAPAPDIDRKWWNIGVRIEDDVLITAQLLSGGAPRTVAEIEALMREQGLGNQPGGKLPPPN